MKTIEIIKTGNHEVFGDYDAQIGKIEISGDSLRSNIKVEFHISMSSENVEDFIEELKELLGV